MKNELLPCPFCGYDKIEAGRKPYDHHKDLTAPFVRCIKCGAAIHLTPDCTDKEVQKRWNTRPAEEIMRDHIKELHDELVKIKGDLQEKDQRLQQNTLNGLDVMNALEEAKDDKEVFRDTLEFIINHVALPQNGFYRQKMKEEQQ